MPPSDQTKRELVRRRFETVRSGQEAIVEVKRWLAKPDLRPELRREFEHNLEGLKEMIERWSAPFDWELKKTETPTIPKALARAMNRLRRRTRKALRRQQQKE